MRWSTAEIAEALEAGLRQRAEADDAEHAVYGFDALDELSLHPILAKACETHGEGWGVWPEQRYPGHWAKRKKSEGLSLIHIFHKPTKIGYLSSSVRFTPY